MSNRGGGALTSIYAAYDCVVVSGKEESDGVPLLVGDVDRLVRCGAQQAIGPSFHHFPNEHNQSARNRRNIDPFTVLILNLKPTGLILCQDGKAFIVAVRTNACFS